MAPADVGLRRLGRLLRHATPLQLLLVEPGAQHIHGLGAVAVLRAVGLAGDDDAGGQVGDADGGVGAVDVLAAGTRGTVGVDLQVALVDVDLDPVVDHGEHPDAGEAGVPPRLAVEGRDAHQAVHAGFGLEPAIGVEADDLDRGRLDPGLLAAGLLDPLHLVAVLLGPAQVHAEQHLGPVLGLGAARPGIDLEEGIVGVGLA